ncbi:MAG TPA: glycoside hydrolase family 32 protein [Clostridiales bacterium]|mgnify:CR=1 FL=1|nr:glycoside hydrolase family 32 protein [Clostridiales bacterium]
MILSKELLVEKRYLNFPVDTKGPKRLVKFIIDDCIIYESEIQMAKGEPEFWVFLDVDKYKGRKLNVSVTNIEDKKDKADKAYKTNKENKGNKEDIQCDLDCIIQEDSMIADDLYMEKYRPQVHFSSKRGWLNDPNGLIYYKGEYHLFYQHNPYGCRWGNMHWGHAVSKDLVHWEELGDALYPDNLGTMYSGSGAVDWNNTSGFQICDEKVLVLIYTAAGGFSEISKGQLFTQCIAYSNDKGRTWVKYSKNPVLRNLINENRDPKVIWNESMGKWVMALYMDKNDYALLTSPNLKEWTKISEITLPNCTECPDIFELRVDNDPNNRKWVFWGANTTYIVGSLEDYGFKKESEYLKSHSGTNCYAAQTWNGLPIDDGRCIQIAWLKYNIPDMPFNQSMTFPCELSLRTTDEGIRLFTNPVKEIEELYNKSHTFEMRKIDANSNSIIKMKTDLLDVKVELNLEEAEVFSLNVCDINIEYIKQKSLLICLDQSVQLKAINNRLKLRIINDRTSIEIFGNDGLVYMVMGAIRDEREGIIKLTSSKGDINVISMEVNELKSMWL